MIKAVLLDLDDTLLRYPEGGKAFVRRYVELFDGFMESRFGAANCGQALREATREVTTRINPVRRNQDVVFDHLRMAVPDMPETALRHALDLFYADVYRDLEAVAQPVPGAPELVDTLRGRGFDVIIATNPIYPATAIKQRMMWAGLDPADGKYARITNAENAHFTKPHPHYFEEIMAQISLEPYEAIMVGDSIRNDIEAAARTGMTTYWMHEPGVDVPESADASGSLSDFAVCVERGWLETLPSKPIEPAHIIPRLTASIAALYGTIHGIPDRFWNQRPDPKEWTPLEVVMHLKEYEIGSGRDALQTIVKEDNPFIRGATLPPQPGERDLRGYDGWEVANQFAQERQKTVAFLEDLPAEAWYRPARHSFYGPTTLLDMAAILSRHDQLHIRQLCQTIGQCE